MVRYSIAVGCLLLLSCSMKQDISMAQTAIAEFHHRFEAGDDGQIFTDAAPEYQKAMGAETSRAFFARIRRKLGAFHSSQPTNIQVNHMPGGTFVVAQYQTQFEKGSAQEDFTLRIDRGRPRLLKYS